MDPAEVLFHVQVPFASQWAISALTIFIHGVTFKFVGRDRQFTRNVAGRRALGAVDATLSIGDFRLYLASGKSNGVLEVLIGVYQIRTALNHLLRLA